MTNRELEVCVVLEQNGHRSVQVGQLERLDVHSVDKDFAFCRIVDSRYKLEDCALPRSIGADNHLHKAA
jgi:hypothetical protein